MASFMDYLSTYEKKLDNISKPKEKLVVEKVAVKSQTRQGMPPVTIVEADKKTGGSSFSICTACGTKQATLLEGTFCPSCGTQSLIKSTGIKSAKQVVTEKKQLVGTVSHAEALLDDEAVVTEEYISPLQKLVKQKKEIPLEERHQMRDHASDLLGDDDDAPAPSMNFIPMPDFSSVMNRQRQQTPIMENKSIDPALQIVSVPIAPVDSDIANQMRNLGLC